MFCSISGQVPEEPVVSKKSGHLYEKRLVVKYIEEQGVCPVTGEPLTVDDLLPLKSSTSNNAGGKESVKAPRPVNATSIPGMLQMFQNEWDALMLETYTLKQHLDAVRQELSHALYQHDAACRVIARLSKERDEARAALASARANSSEVSEGITKDVVNKINQTAEKLSAARKKRQVSPNLASVEKIQKYKCTASHPLHSTHPPGITSLAVHPTNNYMIFTGGADGDCILFNKDTGKILATLSGHTKAVRSVLFHQNLDAMFSCSADKTVRAWSLGESGEYKSSFVLKQHTDAVTGMALHPVGDYLIASSLDKTWSFNDITTGSCLYRSNPVGSEITSTAFHPDGLILATGLANGAVKLWDAKAQSEAAEANGKTGAITSVSFSENGFIMAVGSEDGLVKVWDLRKLNNIQTFNVEAPVQRVTFDHSGLYLAVASNDVRVYQSKVWTELTRISAHKEKVTDVAFGPDAAWLASSSMDRTLKLYDL